MEKLCPICKIRPSRALKGGICNTCQQQAFYLKHPEKKAEYRKSARERYKLRSKGLLPPSGVVRRVYSILELDPNYHKPLPKKEHHAYKNHKYYEYKFREILKEKGIEYDKS